MGGSCHHSLNVVSPPSSLVPLTVTHVGLVPVLQRGGILPLPHGSDAIGLGGSTGCQDHFGGGHTGRDRCVPCCACVGPHLALGFVFAAGGVILQLVPLWFVGEFARRRLLREAGSGMDRRTDRGATDRRTGTPPPHTHTQNLCGSGTGGYTDRGTDRGPQPPPSWVRDGRRLETQTEGWGWTDGHRREGRADRRTDRGRRERTDGLTGRSVERADRRMDRCKGEWADRRTG